MCRKVMTFLVAFVFVLPFIILPVLIISVILFISSRIMWKILEPSRSIIKVLIYIRIESVKPLHKWNERCLDSIKVLFKFLFMLVKEWHALINPFEDIGEHIEKSSELITKMGIIHMNPLLPYLLFTILVDFFLAY